MTIISDRKTQQKQHPKNVNFCRENLIVREMKHRHQIAVKQARNMVTATDAPLRILTGTSTSVIKRRGGVPGNIEPWKLKRKFGFLMQLNIVNVEEAFVYSSKGWLSLFTVICERGIIFMWQKESTYMK